MIGRRHFLAGALAAAGLRAPSAAAQEPAAATDAAAGANTVPGAWHHALTMLGEPKYGPDFAHFEYADPAAPAGGLLRLAAQGGFDNLNYAVDGRKGDLESGLSLIYDQLMDQSQDEPFSSYGLLAEAVRVGEDGRSVTFRLRQGARWHDGAPLTAEDVVWSFATLKENHLFSARYYQSIVGAEITGAREVTFRFDEAGNRELPQIIGQMPVLPKHWWTARGADGKPRDVTQTTLEIPLGSGPYRLARVDAGRSATYERVADYWGRDLPVNRGRNNFGTLRREYFRDRTALLEGIKGDLYDFHVETRAADWAKSYDDLPAVKEGRLIKEAFPDRGNGIMQAFVFNLRRETFKDERVRRAFNLALDFEELNRQNFYGQYSRIDSYFYGSDLAASGLPEGQELAILESVRDKVPASVFTAPYRNPVNGSPEAVRTNLREAVNLLREAGYEIQGGRMVEKASGKPLAVEFLEFQSVFEPVILRYAAALKRIGIDASLRIIDTAQYQNRLRTFDFDIITTSYPESNSPGNEQRDYWGSAAADTQGSRNYMGIKDPGIDALIERVIYATDREGLVAATRALDRVLLAHNFLVPNWSSPVTRTLRWNRFNRPKVLPRYGGSGFPTIWWYDEALAARTGAPR